MKILIAVTTCARYLERRNAIRDTWMSWVAKLNPTVHVKFFAGSQTCPDDFCNDIIHLCCPDDYEHLPKKTLALAKYAFQHRYDLLLKLDDDSYFLPLPEYIGEFAKHDCLGSIRFNPPWNAGINYPQGGCYSLSKKAMVAIVKQPQLFTTGLEDASVGKALHSGGICLKHSDNIKTDDRHGYPNVDGIMSAHCCTPETLHAIHRSNTIYLLAAYSALLQAGNAPASSPCESGVRHSTPSIQITPISHSTVIPDAITLALTSCQRPDLLKTTLESFAKQSDLPVAETIIIEDSSAERPAWLTSIKGLGKITWLANGKRCGQVISIDRLYDHVTTEFIFHCEDDWEFIETGFLKQSLDILKCADTGRTEPMWTVSLRGDDCNGHPNINHGELPLQIQQPYWRDWWGGCTWNPGLRRLSDWQRIGSYGKVIGYGVGGIVPEQTLSKLHLDMGYRIAVLPVQYVKHIGVGRSKAIQPLPKPPKVLIAIPACQKYEYGAGLMRPGVKRVTEGRIQAIRDTWINDIEPFSSYVDYHIFYGNPTRNTNAGGQWQSTDRAKFAVGGDEVLLDCPDDYRGLSHKMQAICQYALEHGYEYLFKADDDSWVCLDRLMRSGYEHYDQLGFSDCTHRAGSCSCYITGGPGYWLSKKAMQLVVKAPITHWAEDLWIGGILRSAAAHRQGNAGYLPGFAAHYVSLPLPPGTITAHAITTADMRRLYAEREPRHATACTETV